jgi:hypothetical protein
MNHNELNRKDAKDAKNKTHSFFFAIFASLRFNLLFSREGAA